MYADISVFGLKKLDYNECVFNTTDDLYFRGNETKAHCDTVRKTFVREPIDIQYYLTNAQIMGYYNPESDFLRTIPKKATLQSEPFKGNVAVNQYGMDYEYAIQVDNDHFLSMPKIDSYGVTEAPPSLNLQPEITKDYKNALKYPTKLNIDGKPIPEGRRFVKNTPIACLRDKNKMKLESTDMSILKKQPTKRMNKRALRSKVERVVDTISLKFVDPIVRQDLAKYLKNNTQVLHEVFVYADKSPEFRFSLDNFLKEHTDLLKLGLEGYNYKKGTVTGRSLEKNMKEKDSVSVCAGIASIPSLGDLEQRIDSKCFLDDRFVSKSDIEPTFCYAVPPQPVELRLPEGNRCRKFIL